MSGRFDVFHALDMEKQQRIIKAALVEFGEKGYKRASTSAIAEKAQIGKGMLFYYFGSKEELFDFLCEYTIEFAKTEYAEKYETDIGDYLKRCIKLAENKQSVIDDFSEVIRFYEHLYGDTDSVYFQKYKHEIDGIRNTIHVKTYANVDYSLFRDDLPGETVLKYLRWLMDGYERDLIERIERGKTVISDETVLIEEWKRYYAFIDELRSIFYKEELRDGNN